MSPVFTQGFSRKLVNFQLTGPATGRVAAARRLLAVLTYA
jgi:hypothetical protein